MKVLHIITWILVVVGALNWGLVGLFKFDLVMKIFGDATSVAKLVYILIGLSAVVEIATHYKNCRMCGKQNMPAAI